MIEAAYMTGILPVKKYGTQSALTDFREYTMVNPRKLAKYVGFTEAEVYGLCQDFFEIQMQDNQDVQAVSWRHLSFFCSSG